MTIFQKMLVAPLLSLLLYGAFSIYSQSLQKQENEQIVRIRNDFLPVFVIANENTRLFNEVRGVFKDAVVAGEPAWLEDAQLAKQQLDKNILLLSDYPEIIDLAELDKLTRNLDLYYSNAHQLALSMLGNSLFIVSADNLIQDVERYHNSSESQITALREDIDRQFRQTVDDINLSLNQLITGGAAISIALLLLVVAVALSVSLTTRSRMKKVIARMEALASGETDFSHRLEVTSKDEMDVLIYWFNKLSDKLEQNYKAMESVSITDGLTQLNNRGRADSFLLEAMASSRAAAVPLAIILIDIDHFKKINDEHGHVVGDDVLIAFAEILRDRASERSFIGRWGGEEFIIILRDYDSILAGRLAEELRANIHSHNFRDGLGVTASFGVGQMRPEDDVVGFLKRTDDNLYRAKREGRDRVNLGI
ncbi:MAG: GGDEF domain-containing protein [Pseudomonadales bacterium]